MNEDDQQYHLEHRSQLQAGLSNSYGQFDKSILLLAGGTIIVSLTVIKDVVPLATANYVWLLVSSWIALVLSLLFIVFSFVTSQLSFKKEIKNWDDYCVKGINEAYNKFNIWSYATTYLNFGSLVTFLVGIILLLLFVFKNLNIGDC